MTPDDDLLSAYLDGELPDPQVRALERRLADEPALQRRLDALRAADAQVAQVMGRMMSEPVPLSLVRAVSPPRPARGPVVRAALAGALAGALAAALATVALVPPSATIPAAARSWTDEIVAYHRIYAREGRHLVEVGADEADHIRAWLGDRIGRAFDIPDLTAYGLTFRGARLLVAAGEPVAQLVYTLDDGSVFALCLTPRAGQPDVAPGLSRLDEFDAVIWRTSGTAVILLGPADRLDLMAVSQAAGRML